MAKHNDIGKIGENIAKTFLMKHGFSIKEQNYRVPYGEIDLIAEKDNVLHIIEVKSIEVRSNQSLQKLTIRPEDNMTFWKKQKLKRSLRLYLSRLDQKRFLQVDLICVYINQETREGRVKYLANIEL